MNQTLPALQHPCPSEKKDKLVRVFSARQQFIETEFQDIVNRLKSQSLCPSSKVISSLVSQLIQPAAPIEKDK